MHNNKPQRPTLPKPEKVGWGFQMRFDTELDALRAHFVYRHAPHGANIEFAPGVSKWILTVYNADAADMGIDGAK